MENEQLVTMARRIDSACRSFRLIASMAGNPDPSEACRLIIAEAKAGFDALTRLPGDPPRKDFP